MELTCRRQYVLIEALTTEEIITITWWSDQVCENVAAKLRSYVLVQTNRK